MKGVEPIEVNLGTKKAQVRYNRRVSTEHDILAAIEAVGFEAVVAADQPEMTRGWDGKTRV